ncbi:apoptosis-associated speck-like protein containing a CARD isoform b, partial [Daubentonia madagascariensis]
GVRARRHPGGAGEPDPRRAQEVQAEAAVSTAAGWLRTHPAWLAVAHGRRGPHRQAGQLLPGGVWSRAHGGRASRHGHAGNGRATAGGDAQGTALCGPAPGSTDHTGYRRRWGAGRSVREGPDRGAVPGSAGRDHQSNEDEEALQLCSSLEPDLQGLAPPGPKGDPALPGGRPGVEL